MSLVLSVGAGLLTVWIVYILLKQLYENLFVLPPGPWGLPFVGYFPFLPNKPFHLFMADVADKYGPISSVRIGEVVTVQLAKGVHIRDAFGRDEMSRHGDQNLLFNQMRDAGERALIAADGPMWKLNRKIGVKALSMFTTQRNTKIDSIAQESIDWLLREIEEKEGQAIKTKPLFIKIVGANAAAMVFGNRPDPEDPLINKLVTFVYDLQTKVTPEFMWYFLFPTLMKIRPSYQMRDVIRDDFVVPVMDIMAGREYNQDIDCIADAIEMSARETDDRKKQEVMANIYSSNYDSEEFPEPFEFRPERYLTVDGHFDQKAAETVLSFGTGRRRCPVLWMHEPVSGEMLARQHLFLLLGCILQKFNAAVSADTRGKPVYETIETPLVGAGEHKIVFTKR